VSAAHGPSAPDPDGGTRSAALTRRGDGVAWLQQSGCLHADGPEGGYSAREDQRSGRQILPIANRGLHQAEAGRSLLRRLTDFRPVIRYTVVDFWSIFWSSASFQR
jgi:hypothetical protein